MRLGQGRTLKKTKIEIIPMIDTMFFLLVFFILSSLGIVKLQGINIDLPKQGQPSAEVINDPKKPVEITVAITADGSVSVNKQLLRPNQNIGPFLQREVIKQKGPTYDITEATVVISADPNARHGELVRCIDEAHAVNINRFAIANLYKDASAAPTPGALTAP
jgi:biopolymer transport protein ExbD